MHVRGVEAHPCLHPRVHASSLCIPKTSPQSALRSGPSLAQSGGSDSPEVSVTTPSIEPQPLMREPCPPPEPPSPPPRFVTSDTTPEKLGELLARSSRGILVKRDEVAGWIGGMEKYGGSRGGA